MQRRAEEGFSLFYLKPINQSFCEQMMLLNLSTFFVLALFVFIYIPTLLLILKVILSNFSSLNPSDSISEARVEGH